MRGLLASNNFLAVMNSVICPGCKKSYAKGLSFGVHKRNCRKLAVATQELYKKREAYDQPSASGLKTARYEDSSVNDLVFQRQDLRDQINSDIDLPHAESSSMSAFSFLPFQKIT